MAAPIRSALFALAAAVALGLVPLVLAHGGEDMEMGDMGSGMDMTPDPKPPKEYKETYFSYAEHSGALWAHVVLMSIGWVIVLPVAVMFSLARSRFTLLLQFVFLALNAFGLLLGTVYNASTPDLYPNNAHHKIGWLITWVAGAQVLIGVFGRLGGAFKGQKASRQNTDERGAFLPVSSLAFDPHHQSEDHERYDHPYRTSGDSGQSAARRTESLRSNSSSTLHGHDNESHKEYEDEEDIDLSDIEIPQLHSKKGGRLYNLAQKLAGACSSRVWRAIMLTYNVIDRIILPFGFVVLVTGVATHGRFFEGHGIYSGLAHWIKGGIFFWLGIFTLGRWTGCFGELGWAWNVKPKSGHNKWRPSAEFAESFLIFFYGSTNVFLEHLGNSNKAYSAQDLEHVAVTVLFIGGGACGMLVESVRIRDLLNANVTESTRIHREEAHTEEEREALQPPPHYGFSINPIPALVILLLGIMMSSHHQSTMVATMVHKQWGNLLTGASFARGFTYVLLYLKPPKSVLPSRPPTELLAAFGLLAGGLIFMASSQDTVDGMIHYDLDAMFFYTVSMGGVGLLMAWIIIVIALKGWAVRHEAGRQGKFIGMA